MKKADANGHGATIEVPIYFFYAFGEKSAEGQPLFFVKSAFDPEFDVDDLFRFMNETVGTSELSQHDMVVAVVDIDRSESVMQVSEHVRGYDPQRVEIRFGANVQNAAVTVHEGLQSGSGFQHGGQVVLQFFRLTPPFLSQAVS